MIQNNNNLSVLPFYPNIEWQNHRKSYAYNDIYPLYAEINKLLPFQIIREHRDNDIINVSMYYNDTVIDITTPIKDAGLRIYNFTEYDIITYNAILPLAISQQQGRYYISISDGVDTWFSDVITVVNNINNFIKIEWYDYDDLVFDSGRIVYQNNFKNYMYICSQIGKPDYTFEEDGEDRDGYFFPEKQLSEKTYRFIFLASEFTCDVMRLIRLSDKVTITDNNGIIYKCDTFLMTPKWQTQGNLASVEVEFQTNTIVKKCGKGYIIRNVGDFNNDYNEDFNN